MKILASMDFIRIQMLLQFPSCTYILKLNTFTINYIDKFSNSKTESLIIYTNVRKCLIRDIVLSFSTNFIIMEFNIT